MNTSEPSASIPPPAIELRNVSVYFGDSPALEDISLTVRHGQMMILLGTTGSGKSVLLKTVLGLIRPDAGHVFVDGHDLSAMSESEIAPLRGNIGMVFQEGALFDSLDVYENVAYRMREEGRKDEAAIEGRVREVLQFVEMEQAISKTPAELSGGMRRRVAIARAVANRPPIMLYDSPTAGLDPVTANTINILILRLRDVFQRTSIVVTHRLQDALFLSDFVYADEIHRARRARNGGNRSASALTHFAILKKGTACFSGTLEELAATEDPYLRSFIP